MLIKDAVSQVTKFHMHIGEQVATTPGLLSGAGNRSIELANHLRVLSQEFTAPSNKLLNRAAMAIEELAEWIEAHQGNNRVEAVDALADRLFVLLGDAVASGLPIAEAFEIVATSNLSKANGQTSPDGKGVKGSGYTSPKNQLKDLLGDLD